ncbi:MAG: RcnB family protein [Pseudomonadota bacterium]|nr:RcnB family protein [Pseudomonadota bacterium]
MKTVIKALLAATALLPVGAYAQNAQWQHRGNRGEARANRDNTQRGERQRGDGQRGQWRNQVDAQPQMSAAAQAQAQLNQRDYQHNRQDRRGDQTRSDHQGRVNRPVPYQAPVFQNRQTDQGHRDRQGYDNGSAAVQRYQNERRAVSNGRQNWHSDRDDAQHNGTRYDNRGTWNRDWRGDNRYNYNSYRTSNRGAYRLPRYYAPSNWSYGYRRFSIGVTLSSLLWDQNYWIDDAYSYRLPAAYGPYRWVRYYDDALLIDIRSGRIVDSVYGIFY